MSDFDAFWAAYPRKLAKKDAVRAWAKVPPSRCIEVLAALKSHIALWAAQGTEKHFIPYPASWLNGARWEDEIEVPPEMPRCDWNRNGTRDQGGRCADQAVKEDAGQYYCALHCTRLGLRLVRG